MISVKMKQVIHLLALKNIDEKKYMMIFDIKVYYRNLKRYNNLAKDNIGG
jgi:hypothetical protein